MLESDKKMFSFMQKTIERYATASPRRRGQLKAAGSLLAGFGLLLAHEAITGRPIKAFGLFLAGVVFVGFILLIGFIMMQTRKWIGKNAAAWLGAIILLGGMVTVIGVIFSHWGK